VHQLLIIPYAGITLIRCLKSDDGHLASMGMISAL
jgi:hypothetical protein